MRPTQAAPVHLPQQLQPLSIPHVQALHHEANSGDAALTPGTNLVVVEVPADSVTREDEAQQQPQLQVQPTTQTLASPVFTQAQNSAPIELERTVSPLLLPILTIDCARPSEAWAGCGGLDPRFYVRFQDVSLHEVSGALPKSRHQCGP